MFLVPFISLSTFVYIHKTFETFSLFFLSFIPFCLILALALYKRTHYTHTRARIQAHIPHSLQILYWLKSAIFLLHFFFCTKSVVSKRHDFNNIIKHIRRSVDLCLYASITSRFISFYYFLTTFCSIRSTMMKQHRSMHKPPRHCNAFNFFLYTCKNVLHICCIHSQFACSRTIFSIQ